MKREEEKNQEGESEVREDVRSKKWIAVQFEEYGSQDGITEILNTIKPFLDSGLFKQDENLHLVAQLRECQLIEDKEVFIDRVSSVLKPVLDLKKTNPIEFQQIDRERNNTTAINEVLSYNRALYEAGESQIFIHLDPLNEGNVSLEQFKDGLKVLAQKVNEDKTIEVINANSWITAKNPGILKRLGFSLGKLCTDEEREKYFGSEKRPVRKSSITRDEFLKKYLKHD